MNHLLFYWKSLSCAWIFVTHSPWNSPSQNTGVGSLSFLQGIFPTQGSNPGLPHCRQIIYQLRYQRSPRILEWVAYPFSRGSSQTRNWTGVSCIAVDSLPAELPGKPLVWYNLIYFCSFCLCLWCHIQKTTVKTSVEVFPYVFF